VQPVRVLRQRARPALFVALEQSRERTDNVVPRAVAACARFGGRFDLLRDEAGPIRIRGVDHLGEREAWRVVLRVGKHGVQLDVQGVRKSREHDRHTLSRALQGVLESLASDRVFVIPDPERARFA
jgi:hypothetical protein